jgi:hypothetical protein
MPSWFHSDVSRPDRLSSAEISSVVQAAGLQGIPPSVLPLLTYWPNFAAVRKNRYVILPIDFEEAWKVCNLFPGSGYMKAFSNTWFSSSLANSQEKRRNTRVLYAWKLTECVIRIDRFCFPPQIGSICKPEQYVVYPLVVMILTPCSFPCTLVLLMIHALSLFTVVATILWRYAPLTLVPLLLPT